MEIVKYGSLEHYSATCKKCSTVFKFKSTEMRLSTYTGKYYVDCPLCFDRVYYSKFKKLSSDNCTFSGVCPECEELVNVKKKDFSFWFFGLYCECPNCKSYITKRNFIKI